MAKGSGTTRAGSARNPRGVGQSSSFSTVNDYFSRGASTRLASRMTTPDKMEEEINKYTDTISRTLGVDTSRGDWTYNNNVYRSVFGNNFTYADDRLQQEGMSNAINKAIGNMSERERAAFVLASPYHDRSVHKLSLNQHDGTTRSPIGPYDDDVAASALMGRTKEERKEIFNNWRRNLETMTFDGGFYTRRR